MSNCGLHCLKINHITVAIGGSILLRDVCLHAHCGELTALIGRNGAGKSTTFKSLLNLTHPDAGEVRFFGLDFAGHEGEIKSRIGFVPGEFVYYPRRKLGAIAEVARHFYPNWDEEAYRRCLARFALEEGKTVSQLSAGMKVKFALTLALSHRAELLLLDEPTSWLDPVSREVLLEEFLPLTTSPLPRVSDQGEVDVFSEDFSAFVFKIQANMNKAHRDRLAFLRICSGKFQRDTEYYHVQTGKKMRLSQPQTMMAAEREIVEEAYAGDIIGVFDPGLFSIGDTVTVPGKKFRYSGIPTFEPEHFMRVSPKDTMKRKQFMKGAEQIAQEGAIQIFKFPGSGYEDIVIGVVGSLQFDVFEYRMRSEYGVELRMEGLPYSHLIRIKGYEGDYRDMTLCTDSRVLQDFRDRYFIAYCGAWSLGFLTKHNPGLVLDDQLSE